MPGTRRTRHTSVPEKLWYRVALNQRLHWIGLKSRGSARCSPILDEDPTIACFDSVPHNALSGGDGGKRKYMLEDTLMAAECNLWTTERGGQVSSKNKLRDPFRGATLRESSVLIKDDQCSSSKPSAAAPVSNELDLASIRALLDPGWPQHVASVQPHHNARTRSRRAT